MLNANAPSRKIKRNIDSCWRRKCPIERVHKQYSFDSKSDIFLACFLNEIWLSVYRKYYTSVITENNYKIIDTCLW